MDNDNGDADDLGSGWFEVKKVSFYTCLIFSFLCLALMIFSHGAALCLMILTAIILKLP